MRFVSGCILLALSLCAVCAHGKSLLSPAKFPETFADLPFSDRLDILRAGYEDWEPEYDANGRCVRGCPYRGMTIEEDLEAMQRRTNAAVAQLQASGLLTADGAVATNVAVAQHGTQTVALQPTMIALSPPAAGALPTTVTLAPTETSPAAIISSTMTGGGASAPYVAPVAPGVTHPSGTQPSTITPPLATCSPRNTDINPANTVPLGEPVIGRPRISSPFGDRVHPVKKQRLPHYGVDLAIPVGTDVFSPAAGTVTGVWSDNSCGRGIRITHSNGYETVYCHLSEQLVKSGDRVSAGCRIAKSGNTGRSTGPHLHYGIKHDGGYIDPAKLMGRR